MVAMQKLIMELTELNSDFYRSMEKVDRLQHLINLAEHLGLFVGTTSEDLKSLHVVTFHCLHTIGSITLGFNGDRLVCSQYLPR